METRSTVDQVNKNQSGEVRQSPQVDQLMFEDGRDESAVQMRQQALMTHSPKLTQLRAMQAAMAESCKASSVAGIRSSSDNVQPSPRVSPLRDSVQEHRNPVSESKEPVQLQQSDSLEAATPTVANRTGMPEKIKAGIENLSGINMDHVRVHYNSDKPAQLEAHAYTQGNEIHIAPGQEKHLAHEAWHVVQQAQGRVTPQIQMKGGVYINDDMNLENEADLMGAKAESEVVQANSNHSCAINPVATSNPIVQRLVKIKFTAPKHEMEDFDTSAAVIEDVNAERDSKAVSTEDGWPNGLQNAHTTSHVVFTKMLVRDLDQKTWVQAWGMLKNKFQFLHNLVTKWYAVDDLKSGANKELKKQLPGLIEAMKGQCEAELSRGGFSVEAPLWAARPILGDHTTWEWYDHLPTAADGVDASTHLIKPWKPTLRDTEIHRLEEACETWMELRGKIPWTSVNAISYVTGDSVGPDNVENKASSYNAVVDLPNASAKDISDSIIATFDFFPASFTKNRTTLHAAAVAARHVVEHFQYHESIKSNWRDTIAAQFLVSWKEKIEREKATEDNKSKKPSNPSRSKKSGGGKSVKPTWGLDTNALDELLKSWSDVEKSFNNLYAQFKTALL